ncbi:NAD(P)H-dependent oxidoreductase [Sandaracinobacteroides saxicola]|uniref:NAD(P)H-dependent oxidoreductase n=1 Tax=Sandaracinobacteroides saxicola TaxID=2759707 RepID=A0A7G5IIL5_9SPHN|nr:NAD(P)H-dependent oxidoreductase [Sandaracinobacteroides saxicola]QMW23207.1 NAD(P)H-dependent oxidoreductase [Sandaracinobacteroides saxicola]
MSATEKLRGKKVVIFNGAEEDGPVHELAQTCESQALDREASVRIFHLRHMSVAPCLGEFDCWVRTPGRCRIPDEGQEIAKASHDADVVVRVTPVVFGGYGATIKTAMDRHLPLILPFFRQTSDFTHHQLRYGYGPHLVTLGVDSTPTLERRRLFRALAESNAVNKGCPTWAADIFGRDLAGAAATLDLAFESGAQAGDAAGSRENARAELVDAIQADATHCGTTARPKVAILMGSPRLTGVSTSRSIAAYLSERFAHHNVTTELIPASQFMRGPAAADAAAVRLAGADVLFVIAPMYVDALPGPVIAAMRAIAAIRQDRPRPGCVAAIINCGFPEPEQTRYAFALVKAFAHEAGYGYAGGLPVAGGEAIAGTPLAARGPVTSHIRAAIDQAAAHLSVGRAIPHAVSNAIAGRSTMPPALYHIAGTAGWYAKGLSNHVAPWAMRQAPLDGVSEAQWAKMALAGSTRARPLRVIGKQLETPDATTILFEDPAHDPLIFEAGQHVTLEAIIDGERVRRAYSIATIPRDRAIAITVKRVSGGTMSNWLHDHLDVGDLVRSYGPSGSFIAGPAPAAGRRLLLIAGGAGIVPLQAIARQVLGEEAAAQITLIYGAHSPQHMIGRESLMQLADIHESQLRLHLVFENDVDGAANARLDAAGLKPLLDGLDLAHFDRAMVCGPDGMRVAVRAALAQRGLSAERVVEESFVSPRAACVSDHEEVVTLHSRDGDRTFSVKPTKTLLEAALDAGEDLPFSCMAGGCGACQVRIVDGLANVRLDEPNETDPAEVGRGIVPACICRVSGPISFAVAGPDAARPMERRRKQESL